MSQHHQERAVDAGEVERDVTHGDVEAKIWQPVQVDVRRGIGRKSRSVTAPTGPADDRARCRSGESA